jgi:transcriptional regulator with XRE-family HTH domain
LERARARQLRAEGWTLAAIASEVGASKGSVSGWVRDVAFERRRSRAAARRRGPNVLERRKADEIATLLEEGRARVGLLSERDLLIAGVALYAGEGSKADGVVRFANTDPRMVRLFCRWLRHFFTIDEARLRVWVYLHEGLDLEAATAFWSAVTNVPPTQFRKPYRAAADASIRTAKHPYGCVYVSIACARTHRSIMGLIAGLLTSDAIPG